MEQFQTEEDHLEGKADCSVSKNVLLTYSFRSWPHIYFNLDIKKTKFGQSNGLYSFYRFLATYGQKRVLIVSQGKELTVQHISHYLLFSPSLSCL